MRERGGEVNADKAHGVSYIIVHGIVGRSVGTISIISNPQKRPCNA